jgi:hypothetical protein
VIADDPLAVALWRQRQHKPVLEVWCDRGRHRLARLFRLPDEGLRLCTPHISIEARHLSPEAKDSDAIDNFAAALYEIDGGQQILLRCNCGTFLASMPALRAAATGAAKLGTPFVATRSFRTT